MALVECLMCGQMVEDGYTSCPKCGDYHYYQGQPIDPRMKAGRANGGTTPTNSRRSKKGLYQVLFAFGIVVTILLFREYLRVAQQDPVDVPSENTFQSE